MLPSPLPPGTQVIQWCGLCNAAPADGRLTILRKRQVVTEEVWACKQCVEGIDDDNWL